MEQWKDIQRFDGYKISDNGRVLSPKGHIIKPYIHDNALICNAFINGKRSCLSVAQEVYKAFSGKVLENRAKVCYIDNDFTNCNIDNLYTYKMERTEPQINEFNKWVYKSVWTILRGQMKAHKLYRFDIENCVQESVLMIWLHLGQYDMSVFPSFISFCKKYVRLVFKDEYKKYRNIMRTEYGWH